MQSPPLIDSHCHLFFDTYESDLEEVITRARQAGIVHAVTVGTDLESSRHSLGLAHEHSWLSATAGIHPHDSEKALAAGTEWEEFVDLARDPAFVAVGETGLDYFKNYAPHGAQREVFRRQVRLAAEWHRPLVVHTREAHEDTVRILEEEGEGRGPTIIHCFTGTAAEVEDFLELDCYISFAGAVTYKRNEANREAAARVPLERLLIETDAPFLSPEPRRGRRNEPAHLRHTFERIAALRSETPEELARGLRENTCRALPISVA